VASLKVPLTGRRVLDVGCGIARRLAQAREAGASLTIGVDLVPEMLAQSHHEPLLAAADARAIPLADGGFDVVWCRLVLGHVPRLEAVYAELARVCAHGGTVLVTDFHPLAVAAGHRRTFRAPSGAVHELEHHVHTARDHEVAAGRAGLALRERRDREVADDVRDFYARAHRLDAYEQQRGLPLVLALRFEREE
jgi:malonyl-CoA O-methyltransferase